MKNFHISDVLSVTTGRLVSSRHMEGIYDILNFMTDDNLFTHQIPRAMQECEPHLRLQYRPLFPDDLTMQECLNELDQQMDGIHRELLAPIIASWVEQVCVKFGLPEYLPIRRLKAEEHEYKNPIQELAETVGKDRVIVIQKGEAK